MYRLVAIDLDGTLLDRQLNLSPGVVSAFARARAAGAFVTMATGRMFSSALPFARQLGIEGFLIAFQGALIKHTVSGQVLYSNPMPLALARRAISLAQELGLHVNCHVNETILVRELRPEAEQYAAHSGRPVTVVGDLLAALVEPPFKILVISEDLVTLGKLKAQLVAQCPDLHPAYSLPTFLEVMPVTVNKGRALQVLAQHLGIPSDQVMAVGDSFNDLEMLDYAGLSVVMGDAAPEVKARARAVTAPVTRGGVAEALLRYVVEGLPPTKEMS